MSVAPDLEIGSPIVVDDHRVDRELEAGRRWRAATSHLQVDAPLTAALHARGFYVAVETNGTVEAPPGLDWICVSPKATAALVLTAGHELKLVHPQLVVDPATFGHLAFESFRLQPMDGPRQREATQACVQYCLAHPRWQLSVQTHKTLGIP